MHTFILIPAVTLVLWTIVMLVWMAALRLPALAKLKMDPQKSRGGRGSDLDGVLPAPLQWKAHNYNHLHEQPTLFYAVVIMWAMVGPADIDVLLAWGYVVFRIIHSVWQAVVNTIPVRLTLFGISTAILAVLAVRLLVALHA